MAVLKVLGSNVSLTSSWQNNAAGNQVFPGKPSYASGSVNFNYSLPSGSVIQSAKVCCKTGSPATGASVNNINGNSLKNTDAGVKAATVALASGAVAGALKAVFNFKANGNKIKAGQRQYSTMNYKDVYLEITYKEGQASTPATQTKPTNPEEKFTVPPQSVAIYNQENGKIYYFDGVLKIQHTFSVKIEEEPEKHKDEFVNNARNEPDKLSLEVMMSDVYTDDANMTMSSGWDEGSQETAYNKVKNSIIRLKDSDGTWTRSGNAVYVLRKMKQARTKLSIITPQYVHVDMIIANLVVNQEDTTPFGWQGQIDFQHTYKAEAKKNNNTSTKKDGENGSPPAKAGVASVFGNVKDTVVNTVKNVATSIKSALGGFLGGK